MLKAVRFLASTRWYSGIVGLLVEHFHAYSQQRKRQKSNNKQLNDIEVGTFQAAKLQTLR